METAFDPRDRFDMRMVPDKLTRAGWTYKPQAPTDVIRFMTRSNGYVMVRKPRCMPFVISEKEWATLPACADSPTPHTEGSGQ